MHILSGPIDTMSDVVEAVDLNQTAGDIVILSAADSDLNCLVRANSKTSSKIFESYDIDDEHDNTKYAENVSDS